MDAMVVRAVRWDKARMGVLPALDTIEAADHAIEAHCVAENPVLAVG